MPVCSRRIRVASSQVQVSCARRRACARARHAERERNQGTENPSARHASVVRKIYPRVKRVKTLINNSRVKLLAPLRVARSLCHAAPPAISLPSRCPARCSARCPSHCAVRHGKLPSRCSARCLRKTIHQSVSNMPRTNAHVRVPIFQQQLAIKQQATRSTNDLTRESSTDEARSCSMDEALSLCDLVNHLNLLITSSTSTIRQQQLNEILDICIADLRQTLQVHSHRNRSHGGSDTLAANPWNDKSTIAPCAIKPTDATWGAHSATAHPGSAAASSACSAACAPTQSADAVFAHEQRLDPPPPPLLPPPAEQC